MATAKGHIARAVAEGIAASVAVLAGAVAADLGGDRPGPLGALRVDGGLTRSRVLLQAQADLLQVPVLVSRTPDATALGVAALARLAEGETGSPSAEVELTVHPVMSAEEAAERLSRYSRALASTLS
jgi:glycerol kinase